MPVISIDNVIEVSVLNTPIGANLPSTSNLAIFTTELPGGTFTGTTYEAYMSATQVGLDFGTASRTYAIANAIFAQQPNILAGGGQLLIIPMAVATQTLVMSGIPSTGATKFTWGGNSSASVTAPLTSSAIQTAIQGIPGLSGATVTGSGTTYAVVMNGVYGTTPSLFTLTSNTMQTAGSVAITLTSATNTGGESIGAAITRTQGAVNYFGVVTNHTLAIIGQTDLLAAAAIVQALSIMLFLASFTLADIEPSGMITLLASGSFTQTRGLYYGDSTVGGLNAVLMAAAYASRLLSVNFLVSNTALNMHLKTLIGIQPDPTMSQTILNYGIAAGADMYPSFEGTPGVYSTNANTFVDRVYNLLWFIGFIQTNGFNYLQGISTKVPQTGPGMLGLIDNYRQSCEQAVSNGYVAPGSWESGTTFGNQALLLSNILQLGYYIYSAPITLQLYAARLARQAPLVQIAIKEAGAINSSSLQINVNA